MAEIACSRWPVVMVVRSGRRTPSRTWLLAAGRRADEVSREGRQPRLDTPGSTGGFDMRRLPPRGCAPNSYHQDNLDRESVEGRLEPTGADNGLREGGTMDTSRGPDRPTDSRPDRQTGPTEGLHIMIWRQMWR
jgi:hypothetical protein